MKVRHVWCASSTGWTAPEAECKGQGRPAEQRPCFHVCDHHRLQYDWQVTEWSPCKARAGMSNCQLGYGLQKRKVTCESKCGSLAPLEEICERFYERPSSERLCLLRCPENCITSDFGQWSDCTNCILPIRTRYRTILSLASHGGRNCTDLLQTESCFPRGPCPRNKKQSHQYKLGKWTVCTAFQGKQRAKVGRFQSLLGHRRRTVDCVDLEGNLVEQRFCSKYELPASIRLCVLKRDCLVSHWSNWTVSGPDSLSPKVAFLLTRTRNLLQVPRGTGQTCPSFLDEHLHTKTDTKGICSNYRWMTGNWEDCVSQGETGLSASGIQRRIVLCVRKNDSVPVQQRMCAHEMPSFVRSCHMARPRDCRISTWAAWSECLPHKCRLARTKLKEGYRVRTRRELDASNNGGTHCPYLKETQTCSYPHCYSWRSAPSGECKLNYADMQCGEGLRERVSECFSLQGTKAASAMCSNPKPSSRVLCNVPCANDCVVSEWNQWSTCSKSCGMGRNAGFRSRRKVVLATPALDGTPCSPERLLAERQRCNQVPCFSYYWEGLPWSRCQPLFGLSCGVGTRHREMRCYRSDGHEVISKRCRPEEMPPSTGNCTLPCPTECLVSKFTDWSPCPVTCVKDMAGPLPRQVRMRYVFRPASVNGKHCPTLTESRPCFLLPRCVTYHWKLSEWSRCLYADNQQKCAEGIRARKVHCLNDKSELLPEEICISQLGHMPASTQRCYVTCRPDKCRLSEWSEWTGCTKRCGGHRERVKYLENDQSKGDCKDKDKHALKEIKPCNCPRYSRRQVALWSHCILPDTPQPLGMQHLADIGQPGQGSSQCGIGKRYQAEVCMDEKGTAVSSAICQAPAFVEEMCFLPCPQDCQMSEWTAWSPCQPKSDVVCGNGMQTRSRYMIESALDGGRPCPSLVDGEEYQKKPCHIDCGQYQWAKAVWSECNTVESLSQGQTCGPGLQSTIVKCLKSLQEVEESLCDTITKPTEINYCHVPCAGQCVVTAWTSWSNCTQGCENGSVRRRYREIVRLPAQGSGGKCPPVQEEDNCVLGLNCYVYRWVWSDWGVCETHKGASCGQGHRQRFRECVRNDGLAVSRIHCQVKENSREWLDTAQCDMPCPVDCVVSYWTPWSPCSMSCGLGVRHRTRSVVLLPRNGGRACPEHLLQHRPCSFIECFHWILSDWSVCQIKNACGYGVQRRNLTCSRQDGLEVDVSLCPEFKKHQYMLEQSCHMPCPADCKVSDWSKWSPCHRPCSSNLKKGSGTQTRSRVILSHSLPGGEPCPTDLIETRDCRGGYCPVYSWKTSVWYGDRRAVWCQRSDGLKVIGGCVNGEKPTSLKTCNPPCDVAHAFCQDINVCACETGYRAVRHVSAALRRCEKIKIIHNATEDKNAKNQALHFPEGGAGSYWLYGVIAAGAAVIILLLAACCRLCRDKKKHNSHNVSLREESLIEKEDLRDTTTKDQIEDPEWTITKQEQIL